NQSGAGGMAGGGGGGLYNTGSATITSSTISNNLSGDGGSCGAGCFGGPGAGIATSGMTSVLTLINVTISRNRTGLRSTGGSGGGVASLTSGTLAIVNSTISNNQTAASSDGGSGGNGAGLFNSGGTVTLRNTIIAGNLPSAGGLGPDLFGSYNSQDFNLIGDPSNALIGGSTPHNNINQNARLAALANYGGPTETHALLPGSPAIDAGANCVTDVAHCGDSNIPQITSDQRGFARQAGSTVDIGSFESRGFAIAPTSGNLQSTVGNTAFAAPLVVTVSSAFSEPVVGGQVTFTAPGSGASATFPGVVTTINTSINGSGQASTSATANAIGGGPYIVSATGAGITTAANFNL